jgi:hypothetical protein
MLKGECHEIFCASGYFHESVSPQPQSNPIGPFQIFFTEIFSSQGASPVSTTPATKFSTILPKVVDATRVNDAGGKLPLVSMTPAANLPPVSMTPVANNGNNYQTAHNFE